ncbi:MAG: DUF421 domain-containing protein [Clostridia bacterium]|nr:DUF421 domain-containing protein [Clostridia bacterium]
MLILLIKTTIIALLVFFVIRLMGKRQIGEMQPFEFVITLILAEVACLPMNDPYIPLHFGIVPIITLSFLDVIINFIGRKSYAFRSFVDGRSVLLIDKNGLVYENLKKTNMSVDDVISSARSGGYADLSTIAYAIIEPNGKFSVIEKPQTETPKKPLRPLPIIMDGKPRKNNVNLAGMTEKQIITLLKGHKLRMQDVLYMDVRQNGEVYVSPKRKPCFTDKTRVTGGQNW